MARHIHICGNNTYHRSSSILSSSYINVRLLQVCQPRVWRDCDNSITNAGVLGLTAVVQISAGFSACYGGAYLQNYWWVKSLPVYTNVDPLNPGTLDDDAMYQFVTNSYVDPDISGYYYQVFTCTITTLVDLYSGFTNIFVGVGSAYSTRVPRVSSVLVQHRSSVLVDLVARTHKISHFG